MGFEVGNGVEGVGEKERVKVPTMEISKQRKEKMMMMILQMTTEKALSHCKVERRLGRKVWRRRFSAQWGESEMEEIEEFREVSFYQSAPLIVVMCQSCGQKTVQNETTIHNKDCFAPFGTIQR